MRQLLHQGRKIFKTRASEALSMLSLVEFLLRLVSLAAFLCVSRWHASAT